MARYEEIQRRLAEGRGIREIARALGCSRITVREVRDGLRTSPVHLPQRTDPRWMLQLDWPQVIQDLGMGHPMKLIWEEQAQTLTTYSNFWKQFYRKFPEYRQPTVTAREFTAGKRVEVDWADDPIEWIDLKTGEVHPTSVFVAGLGFSQLAFARATADMKGTHWLACHRRMYEYYGGVPAVTVPDCLKQGVLKCHIYHPDIKSSWSVGLNNNQRFRPHVTLARKVHHPPRFVKMEPVTWGFTDFVLVESKTLPEGSVYTVLERFPFGR